MAVLKDITTWKHDIKTIIETTRSASYLDMNLKFERDVLN
jgi:hypothetical protein